MSRTIKIIAIVVVTTTFFACSPIGQSQPSESFPDGSIKVTAPGNHISWAVPVNVDGTRCVLVVKNGAGTAISCDWSKP